MNYRRVHIDKSSIKKEISETLYQIAKWHNTTPKIWIPDYRASTTDIDETLQKIQSTKVEKEN
ncbi:hypothetical protein [Proteiniborus sp. MB09-C3]|uniref:hypothetical protein n=1 Tax=Proteiniborus sp. MB09-C3 TaxID=3050072 RepID=UPI0025531451|nr:hypothetical protein [Proteiniborus sp. MB09-C3]WIV11454.1 hypothetical protein QO263_15335 [Proteiniborus sp. MB09-C3]